MDRQHRIELEHRLAAEENAREAAIRRGDLMAARDCEAAYLRISGQLAEDED